MLALAFRFITALAALALLAVAAQADREPASSRATITAGELRAHVEYLASEKLRGRDTGSPGIHLAEEHIATTLRDAGLLPPPGHATHFLDFDLLREGYARETTSLEITAKRRECTAELGLDARPFDFSAEGTVDAPVIFAGYGITSPEHAHDDYAGLDVTGKVVLVLRHEPREDDPTSRFDGTAMTSHASFQSKADNARAHGAAGMLVVTDPLHHAESEDLRLGGPLRLTPEPKKADDGKAAPTDTHATPGTPAVPATPAAPAPAPPPAPLLAMQVSRSIAEMLVAPSGRTLAQLQQRMDDGIPASSVHLAGVTARLEIDELAEPERVPARNVMGWLEGSDETLRDEIVVVGAHHDHLGGFEGVGDTVYNGADDNASGTAALLEMAQWFAEPANRPRRSMLFMTFTGEERGLLGSRMVVERDLIEIDRVAFMFNLDMVGRNAKADLEVIGDGFVRGLSGLVDEANAEIDLPLEHAGSEYFGQSDHDPFYKRDVPFMFFFTGTHDDYHQLGDHADKLDYDRMARIARLAAGIVGRIANDDDRAAFIHHVAWLGAQVAPVAGRSGERAVVETVMPDSRAQRAGLRAGDEILAIDGAATASSHEFGKRQRAVKPGATTWRVRRGRQELDIQLERPKPGWLGVWPADVEADQRKLLGLVEGEGLLVRQVTADGPAKKAGLLEGDVLLRIGGQPVTMRSLSARLEQIGAGAEVTALLIRKGERMELAVTPAERPAR